MTKLTGQLTITIHQGRNLADKDSVTKQDPFVIVQLDKQRQETAVVKDGGIDPVFNQTMVFNLNGADRKDVVMIEARDRDSATSSDRIGKLNMALGKFISEAMVEGGHWFELTYGILRKKQAGALLLSCLWNGNDLTDIGINQAVGQPMQQGLQEGQAFQQQGFQPGLQQGFQQGALPQQAVAPVGGAMVGDDFERRNRGALMPDARDAPRPAKKAKTTAGVEKAEKAEKAKAEKAEKAEKAKAEKAEKAAKKSVPVSEEAAVAGPERVM